MEKDWNGDNALHIACCRNATIEVISMLIEVGGRELLMKKNDHIQGGIALHCDFFNPSNNNDGAVNNIWVLMIKESIVTQVGGEFGIGSIFNVETKRCQDQIYSKWESIVPSLKIAMSSLPNQEIPILHAAILSKAPKYIIRSY